MSGAILKVLSLWILVLYLNNSHIHIILLMITLTDRVKSLYRSHHHHLSPANTHTQTLSSGNQYIVFFYQRISLFNHYRFAYFPNLGKYIIFFSVPGVRTLVFLRRSLILSPGHDALSLFTAEIFQVFCILMKGIQYSLF